MDLTFVDLRGATFAIENPTDIHIHTVEMYVKSQSSDRRKQKELAQAIRSMIPSLPDHWVSVREYELEDGRNEIVVAFNLQSYELLAITNQAAIAYLQIVLRDLKQSKPKDKAEEAEIRNQTVRIEKVLKESLAEIKNPVLAILKGEEPTTIALDERLETDETPNERRWMSRSATDAPALTVVEGAPEPTESKPGFARPRRNGQNANTLRQESPTESA